MIIWSRWGFLSFVGFGLGVGLAFALSAVLGARISGAPMGALVFAFAALVNLALAVWVFPRLDRPRIATVTRPLAQPVADAQGRVHTHETVPLLTPEGQQVLTRPSSTLFFIPARFIWIPLAVIAVVLAVVTVVTSVTGA